MTNRIEITTMEQFAQLPAEHQALWKKIVFTYALVRGTSDVIDDRHHGIFDVVLEKLNVELGNLGEEDPIGLTDHFLSPAVEAAIVTAAAHDTLKQLGWNV